MTVDELIKALQVLPGDTRVVYTYDSIYGGIDWVHFIDEMDWLPIPEPDHNGISIALMPTGKKIVVLE